VKLVESGQKTVLLAITRGTAESANVNRAPLAYFAAF
jgi:hypothetical protein